MPMTEGSTAPSRPGLALALLVTLAALVVLAASRPSGGAAAPSPKSEESHPTLEAKGCLSCHRFGGHGGKGSDLLFVSSGEWTTSGFTASLWNHGPRMWKLSEGTKKTLGRFEKGEVAAILGELAAQRPFIKEKPGNPAQGKKVFVAKRCGACHAAPDAVVRSGPAAVRRVDGTVALFEALWLGVPAMMEDPSYAKDWPKMTPQEMRDLAAYLGKSGGVIPSGR